MSTVIQVDKLSKCYRLGTIGGGTMRADVSRWLAKLRGKSDPNLKIGEEHHARLMGQEFWALQNVSFEVKQGEILGIIGRNGAGKSTLLKILSRVTAPTSGEVRVKGRIASLLEVGTGFHPELTGRENVFLNGAILGMTKAEIKKKFDEIVAFAEIEEFIDTPVKRYSSGMYVRLAFAVAAHLEPEILIVDEVLAVGDAAFQQKCIGKMQDVSKGGRTVLFVSHNMGVVSNLCEKAVWLKSGCVHQVGSAKQTVQEYLTNTSSQSDALVELSQAPRHGDNGSRLLITNMHWLEGFPLRHGVKARLKITAKAKTTVEGVSLGFGFSTIENTRLLSYDSDFQSPHRVSLKVDETVGVIFEVPDLPLGPGIYNIDVGARSGDFNCLDYIQGAIQTDVAPGPNTPGHIIRDASGPRLPAGVTWSSV